MRPTFKPDSSLNPDASRRSIPQSNGSAETGDAEKSEKRKRSREKEKKRLAPAKESGEKIIIEDNEVKEKDEYAILTNIIHQEWSDLSVKEHKSLKNLKTENLRDHMTDAELIFTALAELSTRQIAETMETKGLKENKIPWINPASPSSHWSIPFNKYLFSSYPFCCKDCY